MTLLKPVEKSTDVEGQHKFSKKEQSLLLQQATTLLIEALLQVLDDPENKDQTGYVSNKGVEQ